MRTRSVDHKRKLCFFKMLELRPQEPLKLIAQSVTDKCSAKKNTKNSREWRRSSANWGVTICRRRSLTKRFICVVNTMQRGARRTTGTVAIKQTTKRSGL
ncbi:hypothetical protein [Choristoneura diversana nucleopolyhedrovirus]|nr:hypothetical protein [Choristoneura diversana nucleopolyhedrovirus]